jgi:sterol desaturase/sphingolipid hydroxylase (fatty acid hydroxylase superfamily)
MSLAIIVVSAFTMILLERRFPYDRGQRVFRKGWFNDLVLYAAVQSYVLGIVIDAIIRFVDARTGLTRLHLVSGWPLGVQMAFFFVVHDFYIYWFHRLQHRSSILWRIHEAHHATPEVDWLSGSRSHALEILVNQTIEFAPIFLLGAAPEVAVFKGVIDAVWGMYIHSNIGVKTGALQYVINGPEMHRWHHSREFTGYGFNYGTKLAIWDWMFGTAYLPATKPPGYGLSAGDDPFPDNFLLQQLWAFRPPRHRDEPDEARVTSAALDAAPGRD